VAAAPRLRCPEHGVHLVSVPWASEGSGFTLLFEAFVMLLAALAESGSVKICASSLF